MAIPKNVRQRMINVMYIVLLALLALQVPKEVTQAFLKINDGIIESGNALDLMVQSNIKAIESKGDKGNQIALDYAERSNEISRVSNELYDFIDEMKLQIVQKIGVDKKTNKIAAPEEINLTNELLIKGKPDGIDNGIAFDLERKIDVITRKMTDFMPRERMDSLFPGRLDRVIQTLPISQLKFDDNNIEDKNWVLSTFHQMPAAGAMAVLSQIQSDLKTSENKLIEEMKTMIGAEIIDFNRFSAQIVAPSSYVLKGEQFTADLFLSASSSNSDNITITANGRKYKPNKDGVVKFVENTNQIGERTFKGKIEVLNENTGTTSEYEFKPFSYTVAEPFANVSPTKMNLFYMGVENPIAVSAAGVLAEDLRVTVDNGKVLGSNGNYRVVMNKVGRTNVYVKDSSGKLHGTYEYRVKRIPKPEARLAGEPSGAMKVSKIRAATFIAAEIEDFEFEAKYQIVSYDLVYIPKNKPTVISSSTNYKFNDQMKRYVEMARPGDVYSFENIRVKGPDGLVSRIQAVNYRIVN